jgi:N-acetylglucosaminyldiphosphoundecaprenol N-acetyl-beta-D-mannosaminyltransferase
MRSEELTRLVAESVSEGATRIIANHNLHSVLLFHRDPRMRQFYAHASAIHADGMPLVLWGRFLGAEIGSEHRVTYVDWVDQIARQAVVNGWRLFLLGSGPGIAAKAAEVLRERHPGLLVAGRSGYFDTAPQGAENRAVLEEIRSFRADVLMVGMGMPRQEHWILDNLDRIAAKVILPSGACFDYLAGVVPTPPRWMGRIGLEWAFRLAAEPSRLWRRYLVEPWGLLPWMWRDLVGGRDGGAPHKADP